MTCTPGSVTRGCTCAACDRLRDDRLTFNQKRQKLSRRRDIIAARILRYNEMEERRQANILTAPPSYDARK